MNSTAPQVMRLHGDDNIVITLGAIAPGDQPFGLPVVARDKAGPGHKIAAQDIAKGTRIRRYGQVIGVATRDIHAGEHVHEHNMGMGGHGADHAVGSACHALPPPPEPRVFQGFRRADGKAGTRNYLGILTSVNCSGSVARFIAEAAMRDGLLDEFENVDGIMPIVHGSGCGMARAHEGYDTLYRTLSGYAQHANFAGILLIGLGCEVMQVPDLIGKGRLRADGNFQYMTIQGTGGTRASIDKGLAILRDMAEIANRATREPIPAGELVVGMQCGGSDGFSGITANPALGHASDLLVRHGGVSILSETTEIYGAEHLLTARAVSQEVAQKLIDRIRWWENYTAINNAEMNNNPSPGNKRGGLTTILEKSLGAVAKSGMAPLADVYRFGEPITTRGFVFMDSPGYDPCSVTGQIASGANLIAFTTGRGSVSGYMPTPCIKLATNSQMYARMSGDMDINCGDIVTDGVSLETKGDEIFEMFLAVASGEKTKSEQLGFGGAEFVPWQLGVVL